MFGLPISRLLVLCVLLSAMPLLIPVSSQAQSEISTASNRYGLQYGFSLKGSIDIGFSKARPNPPIRIAVNAGIGSNFISTWLYPALNLEMLFYNGGMGSKNTLGFGQSPWDLDITTALTVTGGTKNHFFTGNANKLIDRNIPLYYFTDHVYPALQNPFDFSISIGTNIVFTPLNGDKANQRLGFINFHFDKFQISYYNDGGVPISDVHMGDQKDRYYTGGAVVSYHTKFSEAVSLYELSYKKFTGYSKNAFEISNTLSLNYMNYRDPEQRKYNKSFWSFAAGNPNNGWDIRLSNFNAVSVDAQHFIHYGLYDTYHMVTYPSFWSIGGSYFGSTTKIGMQ